MALRCSLLRSNLNIPTSHQLSDQVLMNRLKDGSGRGKYSLRVWTATRLQSWIAVGGILIGAAIFIGPLLWDEWSELLGYRYEPMDPSQMPRVSPDWWENEWRMMNPIWRAGESMPDFFVGPFRFVKEHTGRDLSSAEAFDHTRPTPHPSSNPNRRGWLPWARGSGGGASSTNSTAKVEAPRVLVPLCGDSPIVGTMTLRGFEVDAVDSSRTAMLAAVERTERMLPGSDLYHLVHYHMTNFFEPELWKETIPEKSVDVIYERQGMTSINRDQRRDYAHLLKRALRDDGVMYVEGIFRTGRVKGNKVRGPPYSLSRRELEHLFPESEGYFVRCEEKTDAMRQLSRENRILQRVPRELYVTPFHCVVFKEHAVALDHRKKPPLSL